MDENKNDRKIGIALSGGGMRGIAHIGALKAIEDAGLKIGSIAGASSGSLVGALYAAGYSPEEILAFANAHSFISLMRPKFSRRGFSALDGIEKILSDLIPHDSFDQLDIPLYISMTDIYAGKAVIASSGKLIKTVKASCSIPVLCKPVEIGDSAYIDGGIMNNLPTDALQAHADLVIGVNLIVNPRLSTDSLKNMMKIGMRTFELVVYQNTLHSLALCDIQIQPLKLAHISTVRHKDVHEVYDIGYEATKEAIDAYFKNEIADNYA